MSDENKTIKLSDKDKKYWSKRIDSEVSEKRQEFERAIKQGFLTMGIVYNTLQIANKDGK